MQLFFRVTASTNTEHGVVLFLGLWERCKAVPLILWYPRTHHIYVQCLRLSLPTRRVHKVQSNNILSVPLEEDILDQTVPEEESKDVIEQKKLQEGPSNNISWKVHGTVEHNCPDNWQVMNALAYFELDALFELFNCRWPADEWRNNYSNYSCYCMFDLERQLLNWAGFILSNHGCFHRTKGCVHY